MPAQVMSQTMCMDPSAYTVTSPNDEGLNGVKNEQARESVPHRDYSRLTIKIKIREHKYKDEASGRYSQNSQLPKPVLHTR